MSSPSYDNSNNNNFVNEKLRQIERRQSLPTLDNKNNNVIYDSISNSNSSNNNNSGSNILSHNN